VPVNYAEIAIGKCFAMPNNDVRQVVGLDRGSVSYVVRGKLAFPSWDRAAWHMTSQDVFAKEVCSEVPADWRSTGTRTL
jgi:hypothetical protein